MKRLFAILLTVCMVVGLLPMTVSAQEEVVHTHSYIAFETIASTCTEQGYTVYACECGESYTDDYTDPLGHDWGEGVVTLEPTMEAEGEMIYTCSRCEATKTESIDKLWAQPEQPEEPEQPAGEDTPDDGEAAPEKGNALSEGEKAVRV